MPTVGFTYVLGCTLQCISEISCSSWVETYFNVLIPLTGLGWCLVVHRSFILCRTVFGRQRTLAWSAMGWGILSSILQTVLYSRAPFSPRKNVLMKILLWDIRFVRPDSSFRSALFLIDQVRSRCSNIYIIPHAFQQNPCCSYVIEHMKLPYTQLDHLFTKG